jgi:hypothetical protein
MESGKGASRQTRTTVIWVLPIYAQRPRVELIGVARLDAARAVCVSKVLAEGAKPLGEENARKWIFCDYLDSESDALTGVWGFSVDLEAPRTKWNAEESHLVASAASLYTSLSKDFPWNFRTIAHFSQCRDDHRKIVPISDPFFSPLRSAAHQRGYRDTA